MFLPYVHNASTALCFSLSDVFFETHYLYITNISIQHLNPWGESTIRWSFGPPIRRIIELNEYYQTKGAYNTCVILGSLFPFLLSFESKACLFVRGSSRDKGRGLEGHWLLDLPSQCLFKRFRNSYHDKLPTCDCLSDLLNPNVTSSIWPLCRLDTRFRHIHAPLFCENSVEKQRFMTWIGSNHCC